MPAKGYTTPALVAGELARELTAEQLEQVETLIEQAEAYIDKQTGCAWLMPSPTVDERHIVSGPLVQVINRPVIAVTEVKHRAITVGATDALLTLGADYELIDTAIGAVLLSGVYRGELLKITYTSANVLPADIQRAATLLAADWLTSSSIDPELYQRGIESYSVGADLTVKFRTGSSWAAPAEVMNILRAYEAIVFA